MWYVIRTDPGHEEFVKQQVKNGMPRDISYNCKILYRVCKKRYLGEWHDEVGLFMPGYLFLMMKDSDYELKTPREILETARIFRNDSILSRKTILPIRQDEKEFLEKLTGGKDKIGMSYGVIRNGILEISKGAMMGMESRVMKIDRHKRKGYIKMQIDNKERVAEIGLEITEKIYFMQNVVNLGKKK